MEFLNGGDLYSLLRNLGCLDEDMARVYMAEVVRVLPLYFLNSYTCFSVIQVFTRIYVSSLFLFGSPFFLVFLFVIF